MKRVVLRGFDPNGTPCRPREAMLCMIALTLVFVPESAARVGNAQPPTDKRPRVSHQDVLEVIWQDLSKMPEEDQSFTRYLTLTHFHNAGVSDDLLETYRQATSKLVNSLSWNPRITVPVPVDPARTVLRIDLRHYHWSQYTWNMITAQYPYQTGGGTDLDKRCLDAVRQPVFQIRADWFAVVAITAPGRYYMLLQIPLKIQELETMLRVDVPGNIKEGLAVRAGIVETAVSQGNRMLERHESVFGALWQTYEFNPGMGIFKMGSPLSTPDHANEILFHLPNGLLAFAAAPAGTRRDFPNNVHDPRKQGQPVAVPASCMSCHAQGIVARDDQVRAKIDAPPGPKEKPYPKDVVELVRLLHPPREKLLAVMDEDSARFRDAVKRTGCKPGAPDPILTLIMRHETRLDLNQTAGELGMSPADLVKKLPTMPVLAALAKPGGTIARSEFGTSFQRLIRGDLPPGTVYVVVQPAAGIFAELMLPVPAPEPQLTALLPPLKAVTRRESLKLTNAGNHIRCEFPGNAGLLEAVAIAPGERLVAAESQPGVVVLFDPVTSEQKGRLDGHKERVLAIAFSVDGKLLATVGQDNVVKVWQTGTGALVYSFTVLKGASAARFSPDGKWLATAGGEVAVFDMLGGKRVAGPWPKVVEDVNGVAFSADSKSLALAGRTVHLWDLDSKKETAVLRKHKGFVTAVDFSPDGKWLVSGGSDQTLVLWDLAVLEDKAVWKGHREGVSFLAFTPDSKTVVSGGGGTRGTVKGLGEVKVWDIASGKETNLDGHTRGVSAVAVGASGKLLASTGWDRTVRVGSLDPAVTLVVAKQADVPFEGHDGFVGCLAVSADGKRILTGSADTTVKLWDAATGEERATLSGHQQPVVCVALAGDGKRAFSIGDVTLRHWDLKREAELRAVKLPPLAHTAAFSADAKTLAIGMRSGGVELWDPDTAKVSKVLDSPLAIAQRLAFSADGRFLAACDQQNAVCVWDLNTGKRRDLSIGSVTSSLPTDLALSPDGRTLALSVVNRMVFVLDLEKGEKFRRVGLFPASVHGVTLAPDGKSVFVFSGSLTGVAGKQPAGMPMPRIPTRCCVVQVDVASGWVLQYWDDVPNIPIRGVFAPDGRHLIMTFGNTLKVWIPEKGKTVTAGE